MMAPSFLLTGTAAHDTLRVFAADTTSVVREAATRHALSPTASAALGRTLGIAALMSHMLSKRDDDRVAVKLGGGGPVGHVMAEASQGGVLRGYALRPHADLPPRQSDGKLDVGGLIGTNGEFTVMRLLDNLEPYTGSVPLVSGEVGEDAAAYLYQSEQIPSAVLLGVLLGANGVSHAGGVVVQAMPGASNATLARLESNLAGFGQLTKHLQQHGLHGALDALLHGLDFVANPKTVPLAFRCRCSRQKALDSLQFFGLDELADMIATGGQEVLCDWCNTRYQITPLEIRGLRPDA